MGDTISHTHPKTYSLMCTYVSMDIVKHIRNRCHITATEGIHAEIHIHVHLYSRTLHTHWTTLSRQNKNHDHAVTLIRSFSHTYGMHILSNSHIYRIHINIQTHDTHTHARIRAYVHTYIYIHKKPEQACIHATVHSTTVRMHIRIQKYAEIHTQSFSSQDSHMHMHTPTHAQTVVLSGVFSRAHAWPACPHCS